MTVKTKTFLLGLCLIVLSLPAMAESASKKKTDDTFDVAEGPSLDAVTSPEWQAPAMGTFIDREFPKFLEAEGNYTGAVLEWQRIMHQTPEASVKEDALFEIILLYKRAHQYEAALNAAETFLGRHGKSVRRPRVLYIKSMMHDLLNQRDAGIQTRMELLQTEKDQAWLEEAELYNLWSIAVTGADTFPAAVTSRGIMLQEKLKNYPTLKGNEHVSIVTISAMIPGVGHAMMDDYDMAAAFALLNILCLVAFISAMRSKHWAYAMIFGAITGIVYLSSVYSATTIAQKNALDERLNAMEEWNKLKPMTPVAEPIATSTLNVNADLIGTRKPWQTF